MAWEKKHRALGPGGVVLFHSGFSDRYYKPLPEGRRFAADPVAGKAPALVDNTDPPAPTIPAHGFRSLPPERLLFVPPRQAEVARVPLAIERTS
jgi:hypothetical protein